MRVWILASVVLMTAACSSRSRDKHDASSTGVGSVTATGDAGGNDGSFGNTSGPVTGSASDDAGSPGSTSSTPCVGLQCQRHACTAGVSTTISGKVYDPAGKNPLYNVVVYIPNQAVEPFKAGASCDKCDALFSGKPIAAGLTDATGHFTIKNAPDGSNIPLVIQVGKWRKQMTLATVKRCEDNPQPDKTLRLPRNHTEGDIPNIAISTGALDTLECLLVRVGVDRSEYVPGAGGTGRLHIFQGGDPNPPTPQPLPPNTSPPAPASGAALWDEQAHLMPYDIVLLSCEGAETLNMNQAALHAYASAGGRVFASHFHYAWFNTGPYGNENLATWSAGSNHIDDVNATNATIVTTLPNGQVFPKGQALADWLGTVNALTNGELQIWEARHNADVSATNTPSQAWIAADAHSMAPGATQYFSFNTPTDALPMPDGQQYCGRIVFSDLHVGGASGDALFFAGQPPAPVPVPMGCADVDLSPQEKALEFMLFDLSSCVTPDDQPPVPLVITPQ